MSLFERNSNCSTVALSGFALSSIAACSHPEPLEQTSAPIMADLSREVDEYQVAIEKWLALDEATANSDQAIENRLSAERELFAEAATLRTHILSEYPDTPVSGTVCLLAYPGDDYDPKKDARSHLRFNSKCLAALQEAIKADDPVATMRILDAWREDSAFLRFY